MRLVVAGAIGTGVALLVAHRLNRPASIGFYITGAALLAVAFASSAANLGPVPGQYIDRSEREYRVRGSFSYALVGAVLIAVAVVLERST